MGGPLLVTACQACCCIEARSLPAWGYQHRQISSSISRSQRPTCCVRSAWLDVCLVQAAWGSGMGEGVGLCRHRGVQAHQGELQRSWRHCANDHHPGHCRHDRSLCGRCHHVRSAPAAVLLAHEPSLAGSTTHSTSQHPHQLHQHAGSTERSTVNLVSHGSLLLASSAMHASPCRRPDVIMAQPAAHCLAPARDIVVRDGIWGLCTRLWTQAPPACRLGLHRLGRQLSRGWT